jgi:hypothetical protein
MVRHQLDLEASELSTTSTPDASQTEPAPEPGGPQPGTRRSGAGQSSERGGWLAPRRRRVLIGWALLAVLFALRVLQAGLPASEDEVLIWLFACLFVSSLGDLSRWRRGLLIDWLPLYAILAVYALLRGYASHVLWGPFIRPQVAFDNFIGGGTAPTVVLQRWLFTPGLNLLDYVVWVVYMSHFFTSFVVAAVLWKRNYPAFRRFVPLFVGLTFIGYLGYVLYPAIPPWMASQYGYIPHITRIIPVVWQHVGLKVAAALFTHGSTFANNIAAMPSLHAAYPLLLCLFFWRRSRPWTRALLVGYVLAMAFTLVYTGEHFVIDEVMGWLCAIVVYFGGSRLLDWWQRRRGQRAASTSAILAAAAGGSSASCSTSPQDHR